MISVIIPSHNRSLLLRRVLDTLANQTFPADQFEVIVVLDGCTDESSKMLREYCGPFPILIVEQEQAGPSVARNQGANQANGELLIFLDDDIEAAPGFIQAHANAHQPLNNLVVLGYSPPALIDRKSFFSLELQGWWEAMFRAMQQPGHRFKFTDVLSGNFSISRETFLKVGGFNPDFTVHEDYELGVRLVRAGIAFTFEQKALGIHHEKSDLERSLHRKYLEGIADIRLGRLYPELIPSLLILRLLKYALFPSHVLRILNFTLPSLADRVATAILKAIPYIEKMRMLGLWRKALYGLMGYWYWKGVSQELSTLKDVKKFVLSGLLDEQNHKDNDIHLDLAQGFDLAGQTLEHVHANAISLYLGKRFIGRIATEAGAERLRSVHLWPFLIKQLMNSVEDGLAEHRITHRPVRIEEVVAYSNKAVLPLQLQEQERA